MNRTRRVAYNETSFRDGNEEVLADNAESSSGLIAFTCECGHSECSAPMYMTREEYEKVRAESATFAVVARSHVIPETEDVVAEFDRYVVVQKRAAGEQIARANDPRNGAQPTKVMLVDPSFDTRTLLKMLLAVASCNVVAEVVTAEQAIVAAKDTHPQIVILELDLPGMSGWDALPRIKEAAPDARVVVYSGLMDIDERRLVKLGAFDFVQKGGNVAVVLDAVREAALSGEKVTRRMEEDDR